MKKKKLLTLVLAGSVIATSLVPTTAMAAGSPGANNNNQGSIVAPVIPYIPVVEEPTTPEVKPEDGKKDENKGEATKEEEKKEENARAVADEEASKGIVDVKVNEEGSLAKLDITAENVEDAILAAKKIATTEEAKEAVTVAIKAAVKKAVSETKLSADAILNLTDESVKNFKLTTGKVSVVFGKKGLSTLSEVAGEGAKLTLKKKGKTYTVSLKSLNGKKIKGLGEAVNVYLPIKLKAGQKVYVDGKKAYFKQGKKLKVSLKKLGKIVIK